MTLGILIGLTRARVALVVAGLAWLIGLDANLATRLSIAGLVVAATVADGLLDEQRFARPDAGAKPPPDYRTAA